MAHTDATLRALPAILNPSQDGYHDTAADPAAADMTPATVGDFARPLITGSLSHSSGEPRLWVRDWR
jgi:hypothetical protein